MPEMRSLFTFFDAIEDLVANMADDRRLRLMLAGATLLVVASGVFLLLAGRSGFGFLFLLLPFLIYTLAFRALVPARAMRRLERRASRGDLVAILEMGRIYEEGNSQMPKERDTALLWFRRAAERGHLDSAFHLAELLRQGTTDEDRKVEAMTWYRFAAQKGHPRAAAWLAWAYQTGDGTPMDTSLAEEFKTLAEALGAMVKTEKDRVD